ncbi:MAG TPA: hypothetical protein VGN83_18245 [Falsiroseomonas sp.]|jgi:hypothetical protein|nr:hypothetical protein [Falsiroseomonas sp.]
MIPNAKPSFLGAALLSTVIAIPCAAQTGATGNQGGAGAQQQQQQRSADQQRPQDPGRLEPGLEASTEEIARQLTQSGLQNVQVLDATYLFRATTQQGETVLLAVNPPQPPRILGPAPGSAQTSGSGSAGGSSGSGSSSSGGSSSTGSGEGRRQ